MKKSASQSRTIRRWMLLFVLVLLAAPASAQTTGSIYGTVSDESGAVLPGVGVAATSTQTNENHTTTTNASGAYNFPALAIGTYNVRAELTGFKVVSREGIALTLNRNANVDFTLTIGQVAEEVTVVGDAPLLDSRSNEMGTSVDQRRIESLPTLNRNPLQLVSLVPGANQTFQSDNVQGFQSNRVAFNGARPELSNWLLDGGDNTAPLRNYGNPAPNPDAVQEFRVISNNYSAEFGRSVGAVVNVITKSGTNMFHGSAFEFFRDDSMNKANFFLAKPTTYHRNQFGATLGGPIKKDRTFFFLTYQGVREERERLGSVVIVPTVAQRQGIFTTAIKDPLTGQNFPDNTIPANRIVKPAQEFLRRVIPLPNPDLGVDRYQATFLENAPENQYLAKIDHILSDKHKLSVSYFQYDSSLLENTTNIEYALRDTATTQYNANIHEYWTISPALLNHFKVNYTRSHGTRDISTVGGFTANDLGVNYGPLADLVIGPGINVSGSFGSLGASAGGPKFSNNYMAGDSLDWLRGRHSIKIGGEVWLRRFFDFTQGADNGGTFAFTGAASGNGLADFLLGRAQSFAFRAQTYKSNNQWSYYTFAQDNFRASDRLTLNLGLRYELDKYPTHPGGLIAVYVPGQKSACRADAPVGEVFVFCDGDNLPAGGYKDDTNNIEPRLGFAYNLTSDAKTVVRGGYGLANAFAIFNTLQEGQVALPFAIRQSVTSTTGAIDFVNPFASVPGGNPFPLNPAAVKFPSSAEYSLATLDMPTGAVHQFNLSFQRQFRSNVVGELAYVGNRGYNLAGFYNINAPHRQADGTLTPRPLGTAPFTVLTIFRGDVRTWYDALQARLEKRFSSGFSMLGAYTFGKSLDYVSFHSDGTWVDPLHPELNKGRSDWDRRHVAALSFVWELPFFRNDKSLTGTLLGGWNLSGVGQYMTGQPRDILQSGDPNGDTIGNDRPNLVGDWKKARPSNDDIKAGATWFNIDALPRLASGQNGNFGRNVINGPDYKNVDLSLSKRFRVRGSHGVEVRVEAFNVLNFVNFSEPGNNPANTLYGKITAARAYPDAGGPRSFQLGAKYSF